MYTYIPALKARNSWFTAFFVCVFGISCSKTTEQPTITLPVIPPVSNAPTGEIQSFSVADTLVAFNTGTSVSWLVVGTNLYTIVTYNRVKVANSGVFDTGPLKQQTTFTIAVNNGKSKSLVVKVADSITSLLWNGGKNLYLTKAEYFTKPAGATDSTYVDIPLTDQQRYQIIYFNLQGGSTIIQTLPFNGPTDTGKCIINATKTGFTWQNVEYTILMLDSKTLKVTFWGTNTNGARVLYRYTYLFG